MQKTKIDIGIPAYNEEANIAKLISALLSQKYSKVSLGKIIIFSDGSTDKTVKIVKNFPTKKVLLINSVKRIGQAKAQNRIFKNANSGILILLNADIAIKDSKFIEKLATPIIENESIGLASPRILPLKKLNFFEGVLAESHMQKNKMYNSISSDNIYLCHGRARAFSAKLYKKFEFPKVTAEDAYSYAMCKKLDLNFKFVKNTEVFFRSPSNFGDYLKQSHRFENGIAELNGIFGKDLISKHFRIPNILKLKFLTSFFLTQPLHAAAYFFLILYSKLTVSKNSGSNHIWDVSASSKKI